MQIKTGTASVTNGNNRVIFATADLSGITLQAIFSLDAILGAPTYSIVDVRKPAASPTAWTNSASGLWEIFLSVNYAQATNPTAAFLVQKDFISVPVGARTFYPATFEVTDTQTLPLTNRNTTTLAAIVAALQVVTPRLTSLAALEAFDASALNFGDLLFVTNNDMTSIYQYQNGAPASGDHPVSGSSTTRYRQTGGA
jgi:hypothetical protein